MIDTHAHTYTRAPVTPKQHIYYSEVQLNQIQPSASPALGGIGQRRRSHISAIFCPDEHFRRLERITIDLVPLARSSWSWFSDVINAATYRLLSAFRTGNY